MQIAFELTGKTPLIMHKDDIEQADLVKKWQKDPKNKNVSVAGDDRSPAWTWRTYLYSDGTHIAIPFENLLSCLKAAGAKKVIKGNKTFKESTQAGITVLTEFLPFLCDGKRIPLAPLVELSTKPFEAQSDAVRNMGFRLFLKRGKIGQAKHIRVRPRFDVWSVSGELDVNAEELTFPVMEEIFALAGRVGICDWRPGAPKSPGPFGMFTAQLKQLN